MTKGQVLYSIAGMVLCAVGFEALFIWFLIASGLLGYPRRQPLSRQGREKFIHETLFDRVMWSVFWVLVLVGVVAIAIGIKRS